MKKAKASCLILFDAENRLILQKRSNHPNIFFANCWGLIGGAAYDGETACECIVRECEEETGWVPNDIKFLFAVEKHCIESVFMAYVDTIDKLQCMEGESLRAFTLDQIQELTISSYHKDIIENCLQIRRKMMFSIKNKPSDKFCQG